MSTRAEPADVRDRRHYTRVFGDPLETESLPPWCYASERFFQAEQEAVLARNWVCVGARTSGRGPALVARVKA
jgi:hypothetical protein